MTDFARLVLDADTRGLKSGERDLDSLSTKAKRTAGDVDTGASKMSMAFKRVGAAIGAFAAVDFAIGFGKASVQASIDAQEMQSAFEVVFGSMAKDVEAWAEATGNALGRSTQEIQRGALAFQELFGKALNPAQAAELSKQFAVLTQDLASFKNLSNEVAQQKLFSGLTGEAEPLRAVGVFLSEAAVEAKALQLGIKGVNGDLSDQQKIVVRAAVIQEQLAMANGDVLRTSGSAANQIKTLNAAVEELQVAIGSKLLPLFTPLVSGLAGIVTQAATAAQGFASLGFSLGDVARVVATVGAAWAAYRIAAIAGTVATTAFSGSLGIYSAAVISTARQVGVLAGAQVAMAGATAGARTAMAGLVAGINPLGAVLAVATAGLGYYAVASARVSAENDRINGTLDELEGNLRAAGIEVGGTGKAADIAAPKIFGIGNAYAFAAKQARQLANDARLAQLAQLNADRETTRRQMAAQQGGTSATDPRFQGLRAFGRLLGIGNDGSELEKLRAQERRLTDSINAVVNAPPQAINATATAANVASTAVGGIGKAMETNAAQSKAAADSIKIDIDAIMGGLFPLESELARVTKNMSDLEKVRSQVGDATYVRAREALSKQAAALQSEIDYGAILPAEIIPQFKDWEAALGGFTQKAKTTAVTVAESFRDMAERTTQSFTGMVNALRSGDVLGILDAVIGLGFQLGSIGVFGKSVATKLNTPRPAHANGTNYAPGGLSLVGERGPEWVNMPRGSKVWANGTGPGGSTRVDVIPSPFFNVAIDGRIQTAAPSIAQSGAQEAGVQASRMQSRMVRR